jgi:hypothetical protein
MRGTHACATMGDSLVKAHIEPLPQQTEAEDKAPLAVAVQLLKRARDVAFNGTKTAPRSVVLTTLAGQHYAGCESVSWPGRPSGNKSANIPSFPVTSEFAPSANTSTFATGSPRSRSRETIPLSLTAAWTSTATVSVQAAKIHAGRSLRRSLILLDRLPYMRHWRAHHREVLPRYDANLRWICVMVVARVRSLDTRLGRGPEMK